MIFINPLQWLFIRKVFKSSNNFNLIRLVTLSLTLIYNIYMITSEYPFKKGDEIFGKVDRFSPLGANVILNDISEGLLYENEIFRRLRIGETIKVYIKEISEDGLIALTLQPSGYKNFIDDAKEEIMQALRKYSGQLDLNDKSSPESISAQLKMSKKRFKEAIGSLYKERKIEFTETGIRSTSNLSGDKLIF